MTAEEAERAAALVTEHAAGVVAVAQQLADLMIERTLSRMPVDVEQAWGLLAAVHAPRLRVLAAATAELHRVALPAASR